MKSTCPECGIEYSPNGGGHCRGGAYGGCCRTFTSDSSADAHRIGPHDRRDGIRRCLTDEEMVLPWRLTPRGWTNSKPMDEETIARRKGATVNVDYGN